MKASSSAEWPGHPSRSGDSASGVTVGAAVGAAMGDAASMTAPVLPGSSAGLTMRSRIAILWVPQTRAPFLRGRARTEMEE
jgi:hypothetical protein